MSLHKCDKFFINIICIYWFFHISNLINIDYIKEALLPRGQKFGFVALRQFKCSLVWWLEVSVLCHKLSNLKFWKPSVTPLKLKEYSHAHCLIHKFIVSYLRIEHSFIAKFFKFHPCRIIFSKIIIIWMYSNGIRIPLKIN